VSSVCPEPMVLEFCAKYIQVCHNCIWILISNCPRVWKIPDNLASDLLVSTTQSEQTLVITNTKSSGISQSLGQYMYQNFFFNFKWNILFIRTRTSCSICPVAAIATNFFSMRLCVHICRHISNQRRRYKKKISSKSTCYHLSYHSAKSCDFGVSYQICRYIQSASRITDKNFNFSSLKILTGAKIIFIVIFVLVLYCSSLVAKYVTLPWKF
jgi:hypothetical protein